MRKAPTLPHGSGHILLVDDNKHGLLARKALLEELGYTITTAANGEEAFDLFSKEKFDLVITDYKMPKMNGAELIRQIRSCQPSARIILVSGFIEPLALNEASTGADAVIAKSAGEVPMLVRWVARLLTRGGQKPARSERRPPISRASSG
jgi:CheY-like chemotaxis protein